MTIQPQQGELLLNLARRAIRQSLTGAPANENVPDDPTLHAPAGCFCSLHTQGTHLLRGCVGIVDARSPLYRAIQDAARSVLRDPRFQNRAVQLDELNRLEIELSILSPMTRAEHPLDFDPEKDGIYLTIGEEAGLFLPQVARETGWSKEQLLERLCSEKLGLPENAWKSDAAVLEKFTTQILGPEPF